ncbi:MAG: putative cyclase [Subtercola sp.]|jgi:kynurenine formamidase|nr:putative cyclase [Subtercola sp.]
MDTETHDACGTEKTNWGRWGSDDERGALNLQTDESRLKAMQAVRTGKLYQLGIPLSRGGSPQLDYRGPTQRLSIASASDQPWWEAMAESIEIPAPGVGANEDMLVMPTHNGTHMDALAHVYKNEQYYNGHPTSSTTTQAGSQKVGIDKAGGFAGRAVMLDIAGHLGVDVLEPGFVITDELLEEVREAQATRIDPGDILLLRTGWMEGFRRAYQKGESVSFLQPGTGLGAMAFVDRYDISVIGADNQAVESFPTEGSFLSGHVALLVNRGIHLIENLYLAELAADDVHEFFLAVGVLPIVGGSASPVNPIAIA